MGTGEQSPGSAHVSLPSRNGPWTALSQARTPSQDGKWPLARLSWIYWQLILGKYEQSTWNRGVYGKFYLNGMLWCGDAFLSRMKRLVCIKGSQLGRKALSLKWNAMPLLPAQPNERVRKGSLSYVRRDGSSTHVTLNHTGESLPQVSVWQHGRSFGKSLSLVTLFA